MNDVLHTGQAVQTQKLPAPAFGIYLHGVAPVNHCEIVYAFAQFMRTIPAWTIDTDRYALGQILRDDDGVDEALHINLCDVFPACVQPRNNRWDEGSNVDAIEGRFTEQPECTFEQDRYVTPYQLRTVLPLPALSDFRRAVRERLSPLRGGSEPFIATFQQWLAAIPTERQWIDDPDDWQRICDFARWARKQADFPVKPVAFKQVVGYLQKKQDGSPLTEGAAYAWAKYRNRDTAALIARGLLVQEEGWNV